MTQPYSLIMTTFPTEEAANDMGKTLVQSPHLVACSQVSGPIHSTYIWKGSLEMSTEWRLLLKTITPNVEPILQAIKQAHSYDVPELIVLPFSDGDSDYLEWLSSSCSTA